MAEESPTAYTWELGIDWNAIPIAGLIKYLRQGFVKDGAMSPLGVKVNDTITFKIFDVTSPPREDPTVNSIKSFVTLVKIATGNPDGDPLDTLQLTFRQPPDTDPDPDQRPLSTAFGGRFPAWTATTDVTVKTQGRFLLSFLLQAGPEHGNSQIFMVDPEMVVGPNM
jgi:hypothetical protein